jgi:hypothetical protein
MSLLLKYIPTLLKCLVLSKTSMCMYSKTDYQDKILKMEYIIHLFCYCILTSCSTRTYKSSWAKWMNASFRHLLHFIPEDWSNWRKIGVYHMDWWRERRNVRPSHTGRQIPSPLSFFSWSLTSFFLRVRFSWSHLFSETQPHPTKIIYVS